VVPIQSLFVNVNDIASTVVDPEILKGGFQFCQNGKVSTFFYDSDSIFFISNFACRRT